VNDLSWVRQLTWIFFSVSAQESDEAVHEKGPSLKEEPRNGANEVAAQEREPVEVEDDDGVHCAVCGSTDGDPSNPIVSCNGCDLMVHASCCGKI
jgi:NuA3 HAT complex component NTO1